LPNWSTLSAGSTAAEATHLKTVPIREVFQGKVAWEGEVEVFAVTHP
jgi:hypothetical protein